jgi:hypothetical protein
MSKLFNLKYFSKVYIPLSRPIHPFPNIIEYDPNDYYELPKSFDEFTKSNKGKIQFIFKIRNYYEYTLRVATQIKRIFG